MSLVKPIGLGLVFSISGGLLTAAFLTGKFDLSRNSVERDHSPAADATRDLAASTQRKVDPNADNANASTQRTDTGIPGQAIATDPRASDFSERPGSVYKTSHLASEFPRLAGLADQGDLVAARTLLEQLQYCQLAPKNAQELEKYGRKLGDPKYPYASNAENAARMLSDTRALFDHCGELTDEQRDSVAKWSGQLAAAGDSKARLEFPFIAQPRDWERNDFNEQRTAFVETARNYLNEEIALGNAEALGVMAHAYMPPVMSGEMTPFELDPAMAYRYFYAYALTPEGAPTGRIMMPAGEQITDIPGGILARMESQLSAEQIAHEREAALRIVQQCCSSTDSQ
jgi:hypothetical protein